jgi:predicted TIM-barrel fold metal-dependent hydrolase
MKIVDAHVHLGQSIYGEAMEIDVLLRQMDEHDVAISVVSAFTPPDLDFAKANQAIAAAVKAHPDRLVGSVRVDPRLTIASREEIARAGEQYGFRQLALHPLEQGFVVNHPLVRPTIDAAEQYNMAVHITTGYPVVATPMQVADLARHYPNVPFILGSMGGDSYMMDAFQTVKHFPNLYLETAGNVLTGEKKNGVRLAIESAGLQRVIFASDGPYCDLGMELMRIEVASLPVDDLEQVLGGNCLRLLNLETA